MDLVRINQRYFHTNRRLDAVRVFHQDLQVGIWYLDEHDPEKVGSLQLSQRLLPIVELDHFSDPRAYCACT